VTPAEQVQRALSGPHSDPGGPLTDCGIPLPPDHNKIRRYGWATVACVECVRARYTRIVLNSEFPLLYGDLTQRARELGVAK
jgi:hypothetical protein